MTTDNFCLYLQKKLIQKSQTGGIQYSYTSAFSNPWLNHNQETVLQNFTDSGVYITKHSRIALYFKRKIYVVNYVL